MTHLILSNTSRLVVFLFLFAYEETEAPASNSQRGDLVGLVQIPNHDVGSPAFNEIILPDLG